jgi:hypothetical protein
MVQRRAKSSTTCTALMAKSVVNATEIINPLRIKKDAIRKVYPLVGVLFEFSED